MNDEICLREVLNFIESQGLIMSMDKLVLSNTTNCSSFIAYVPGESLVILLTSLSSDREWCKTFHEVDGSILTAELTHRDKMIISYLKDDVSTLIVLSSTDVQELYFDNLVDYSLNSGMLAILDKDTVFCHDLKKTGFSLLYSLIAPDCRKLLTNSRGDLLLLVTKGGQVKPLVRLREVWYNLPDLFSNRGPGLITEISLDEASNTIAILCSDNYLYLLVFENGEWIQEDNLILTGNVTGIDLQSQHIVTVFHDSTSTAYLSDGTGSWSKL